eukprot:gnl/TRDRNA2_/TRDRNA2_181927_c0_seq1.p1 gnl/TRDRNA2_/TRDRNA2_181927_c0~~gnl/TRDRNA2_/TRDRNA2_181927_c0_seq1.p1  ORF type:complete len:172 (-),score=19.84 gnl/TRDRNA2_/TRDRNA2_181927_c0_seq1:18-488(-)
MALAASRSEPQLRPAPVTPTSASKVGRQILDPMAPPFSRFMVDSGQLVDGGRYGRYVIGHGRHASFWDRNTPRMPESASGSRLPTARSVPEEFVTLRQSQMEKAMPNGVPFETTFERVFARRDPPKISRDCGTRAPLIGTSMGVVSRIHHKDCPIP